jgi:hypothetical protein
MTRFEPRFTITNSVTAGLTAIERARGFLEAATLSDEWVKRMSERALLVEAYATTHIEGTELTLEPSRSGMGRAEGGGGAGGRRAGALELSRGVRSFRST